MSNSRDSNQNNDDDEWTPVNNNRRKRNNNNNVSNSSQQSTRQNSPVAGAPNSPAIYRPPIPKVDHSDYPREITSSNSGNFFKSRFGPRKTPKPKREKAFYQLRDAEFIIKIEDGSLNSRNIFNHIKSITSHIDLSKMTPELTNQAIIDTLDKFLYSAIVRMNLKKTVMNDYIKLIKLIIDNLSERNKLKIGNYNKIKKFNEASGLMWLDDDVDFNAISIILKYLFDKLHTHPFKPNSQGENLFGSLITKFKSKTMAEKVFNERYSLLLESINSFQRKMMIQAVINKLTTGLAYNSESMIMFKMLFLINPVVFIQETIHYFLKNNNNMFSSMDNAVESLYAPKFIETLEALFIDYGDDEEYVQVVDSLSLTPLFKNATLINKDEFFNIISNIIIGYCDTNNKTCIVNFEESDDQENNVSIRARLLSLAYLVSELAKLDLCTGLVDNVVKLFKDNDKIKNNVCFDVCHCILKTRPLDPNAYIDLLKRHSEIGFSGVKLYALAEHLSKYCDIYKNNKAITIDVILNCLQEIIDARKITEKVLESHSTPGTPSKNRKRRNKRRNKGNNNTSADLLFVPQEEQTISSKSISMSAPVTPVNIVTPLRDSKNITYFSVTQFDEYVEYEDLLDDVLMTINDQLSLGNHEEVFKNFFDEVLDKSRKPSVVKAHVTSMVREVVNTIIKLGTDKKIIQQLIVDAANLVEEKKDDLPCVLVNYETIKVDITEYLDSGN